MADRNVTERRDAECKLLSMRIFPRPGGERSTRRDGEREEAEEA